MSNTAKERTQANPATSPEKDWTLRGRMRAWFTLTTLGIFLICYLLGIPFIDQAYRNVVAATLREEQEEFAILMETTDRSQKQAEIIFEELSHRHPELRMAFWAWEQDSREPICLVGDPVLIHNHPRSFPEGKGIESLGRRIFARSDFSMGTVNTLVLDATDFSAVVKRFHYYAAVLAIAAVAMGLVLGELFSRIMSHQLKEVSNAILKIPGLKEGQEIGLTDSPQEIRSVVQSLSEMLRAIRIENQSSDLTIAGLAHELGAPVQNMLGETEVLLMGQACESDYRRVIEVYQDELHQLSDAVHNLVTLCASRGGKESEQLWEEFDLAREAGFRLLREQAAAGKREVLLEIDSHGDLTMEGDKEGILRAMRNLVSNAIAWSPPREVVYLQMDGSQPDVITIKVDDAGPGVPEEERSKIFEMLYRGHDAKGRRVGYGLGLALAHRAITDHGGTIEVGDAPSGGARFAVTLPRRAASLTTSVSSSS